MLKWIIDMLDRSKQVRECWRGRALCAARMPGHLRGRRVFLLFVFLFVYVFRVGFFLLLAWISLACMPLLLLGCT